MTFRIYRLCRTCSVTMIVFVLLCSIAAATAWALPITDQSTLSGLVKNPGTFDLADLKAFPQTTQHVTYQSGSDKHRDASPKVEAVSGSFTGHEPSLILLPFR